ncbi:cutinase [Cordyceps fumosorosea ARSEF 2679]|uniref:cutinase n=1 Tax=Cordyceps fumosorosea (strain ARSEF 2679) TaxID=1081104 RepID=A0A167DLD0_CORFA|nr:cutinase [Cordyceps fumosorosea ARSEF 2679]OAA42549.1 cutinase [Cordyceps fumosorosea ARSEF 2679]
MKFYTFLPLMLAAVFAVDGGCGSAQHVCSGLSKPVAVSTEFSNGGCREIIMFFTRGTLEPSNMGLVAGRELSRSLKERYGESLVATEGIEYPAVEETNLLPGGGDPAGVAELTRLIFNATAKCPGSKIVIAGYSQGAAITHRAVENLPSTMMERLTAVVTFGDTRNKQDNGSIPNFPKNKTLVICNQEDAVCNGTLDILAAHMDYDRRVPEASCFIAKQIREH